MEPLPIGPTLHLVEGGEPFAPASGIVARWTTGEMAFGEHSVGNIVERDADGLASEYLSWMEKLPGFAVGGASLGDALRIAALGGTSFWPLTLIAERSPMKSPHIHEVFKLRALERLYSGHACRGLDYRGNDPLIHSILHDWCAGMGHPYRRLPGAAPAAPALRWYRRLPAWLQAFGFLAKTGWRYARPAKRGRAAAPLRGDLAIVTYFPNIDAERAARGEFRSRYWEKFHDLAGEIGLRPDWIWIYAPSDAADFAESIRLRNRFGNRGQSCHLLHEFLSARALSSAIRAFVELYFKGAAISAAAIGAFRLPSSAINFFPLFAAEWRASLFGVMAMDRLLYLAMFREFASRRSATRVLYLWEGQGWEKALIAACRGAPGGSCQTIGYQHATLPPLDLRPFPAGPDDVMPDLLAVNGTGAGQQMLRRGFPAGRMQTVSALRYLQLAGHRSSQRRALPVDGRTLLIVGGYVPEETRLQLELLAGVPATALSRYARLIFKPHPFCPVKPAAGHLPGGLALEIADRPLAAYWNEVDVVYCANSTSVAIEAAWLGMPIIVPGAGNGMNLCPLYGWPGVEFALNPAILSRQLENPPRVELPADYFCMDGRLDSWRELLSKHSMS